MDAFATVLRSKDRRSVKEWEYIIGAGEWIETGPVCLSTVEESEYTDKVFSRRFELAEKSFKVARGVLSMRAQYCRDITEHEIEEARQMALLEEQGNDAVHSESYCTASEAFTGKVENKAVKMLAKTRLERAIN